MGEVEKPSTMTYLTLFHSLKNIYLCTGNHKSKELHERVLASLISLHHERQVQVLDAVSHIDVTMLGGYGHVEEGETEPQQTPDHANSAAVLKLQTPRACEHNTDVNIAFKSSLHMKIC